eukprot:8073755-Pyramimonas_sp.AAC.1
MPGGVPGPPAPVFGRDGACHCQLICGDGTARHAVIPDWRAVRPHTVARHGHRTVAHSIALSNQCP